MPEEETDTAYANVDWIPGDIQSLRPEWTLEQCEAFLNENEKYIRESMIECGWVAIEALLPPKEKEEDET